MYSIQDLIRKTEQTLSHKRISYQITGKDCVFHKLSTHVCYDFYVIYRDETYSICYQTLHNQIYYTVLKNHSITKKLISSDPDFFYQPRNLKLTSLMKNDYLFSIQNTSKEQKSLIFLPLTRLDIPTILFDVTTSCFEYELFTLEQTIYLVFPFFWENYVLNLYCYDPKKNQWDFKQTLISSDYCYDYFNILQENDTLNIVYTINLFGMHLMYYKCIIINKKNALIPRDTSLCNQSTEKTAELIYKTGSKITPSLLLKENLLWISWLENDQRKSICKSLVHGLPSLT